jgi:hypothetical protein
MKKSRYTEEKIMGVLKQMEAGRKVLPECEFKNAPSVSQCAASSGSACSFPPQCFNSRPECIRHRRARIASQQPRIRTAE